MKRPLILLATLSTLAMTLTAGCGLRGDLERPVPLWGDPPNEGPNDPRTIKAAKEEAERRKAEDEATRKQGEAEQVAPIPAPPN